MNAEQYATAMRRVEDLVQLDPAFGTVEGEELDELVGRVMAYEAEHFPFPLKGQCTAVLEATDAKSVMFAKHAVSNAMDVLEALEETYSMTAALRWLGSPQSVLDGRTPLDLLLTEEGKQQILAAIRRVRDGTFI